MKRIEKEELYFTFGAGRAFEDLQEAGKVPRSAAVVKTGDGRKPLK
jgi:hypothetical protein